MNGKKGLSRKEMLPKMEFWLLVGLLGLFFLIWIVLNIYGTPEEQYGLFFSKGDNYMADLFNVMYYAKDRAPYVNEMNGMAEKAYFPLSYVICYALASVSSINWYIEQDGGIFYNGRVQSLNSMLIVFGVLFMTILMVVVAIQIYEAVKPVESDATESTLSGRIHSVTGKKLLITLLLLCSGAMMFTFERGNLILIALMGMLLFLTTYDSEIAWLREVGYLGLAVAGAMKGYPAILGVLLIYRHEWKAVIRLAIYGVVMAFGPFLLLKGGFSNIPQWLQNLHKNSEVYMFLKQPRLGYLYFISCMENATRADMNAVYQSWKPLITVVGILAVISSYFQPRRWIRVCALLTIIMIYPSNSGYYCLIYLIPVIILYLNEKEKSWKDLAYIPLFALLLSPIQFMSHGENVTIFVINIVLISLLCICLLDNGFCVIREIRNKNFGNILKHGIEAGIEMKS